MSRTTQSTPSQQLARWANLHLETRAKRQLEELVTTLELIRAIEKPIAGEDLRWKNGITLTVALQRGIEDCLYAAKKQLAELTQPSEPSEQ